MLALDIKNLHKHYGAHHALDGVDLAVREGEIYGLLGPNGAGKTTLMKTVLGLQRPTSGSITLFGEPHSRALLAQVGALIEMPGLWSHLDAVTHLRLHAKLRGVPLERIETVIDQVQLGEVRHRRVAKYSLGMRWRLGIAIALLADPRLLILDEPTNGLDPIGVREMRGIIRSLAAAGTTVLISSHQLSEIAQICDRVGVVVAGRTRYEGSLQGLAAGGDLEAGFFQLVEVAGAGVR
ncbi:lantibiotic ABC transporter ATP-binding protein [Actinoplanes ianthinogenes]|uniref:Lantibiotic ABC transporter ATP-binding protein n=1 Tax=Actinoplanes ianthinogenes TaxID=122358 RepID=A0ABM7LY13_9ACTN|nr:ATP-binding cassette domain-containing protein [Actinoplanes ianthinogenes]BCJ44155.1 lantibiotic ABC transporter ATP-binding protein [Actinoplanes ianthinogenes]GGQ96132.1 lantibiotic ABC transporter ATP-binding protein [Actinoplanes ianthinogenes]